ncbi:MAG: glycosyltransferase, partial [Rhizobiales bacterium]|nr:glycosyltransferase [Hyphomicrobiales bacterium]
MSLSPTISAIVDETHCGRHVTGIERITLELFSQQALAPFDVLPVRSSSRKRMVWDQNVVLPLRSIQNPAALVLCSGFPPAPALTLRGSRVVTYIHDLFLLTRPADLNWRARAYMAPSLRFALRRLRNFFVNSEATLHELRRFARPDADIRLYRPEVRNVLGLAPTDRSARAVA